MKKDFDCVEMKNEIQRKLRAEYAGLSDAEYGADHHALKVFVDTSVLGGCFDEAFKKKSQSFFGEVKAGRFKVVVTRTVMDELEGAPEHVRKFVDELVGHIRVLDVSEEMVALQNAYIDAGILGRSSLDDAEHIAAASIEAVDLMVSWNFKHIVHFDKIRAYNAINVLRGYRDIDIRCPSEVISYDD